MNNQKMNLVIMLPDQMRADYLSCYGHEYINTANIDRLSREGVRFNRAYCAAPLCGPSRISFVTSMRMSEHGRRNYTSCIDYTVPNLISSLKQAGYRTGMFGKNHCFLYDQLETIWDKLHEICLGNYDEHPQYTRSFDAFELEKDHPYNITASLTDEAIAFMDDCPGDAPFVCWLNWQDPHPAFTCPKPYAAMFDPDRVTLPKNRRSKRDPSKPKRLENWRINSQADTCSEDQARRAIAMYMGQCRYIDDQVGRLMTYLEKTDKLHNTLIVFLSDHGEFLGDFGVFHKLPVFYECLSRIPVIMRYPHGTVKPFAFNGLIEEVDLAPTILHSLSIPIPQSMAGKSFFDDIQSNDDTGRPHVLVEAGIQAPTPDGPDPQKKHKAPFAPNSYGPGAMVTDGRFKLSMYYDDLNELYDIETDPYEMNNLFDEAAYSDVRAKMMQLLVSRLLGSGVRNINGAWTERFVDVRENPPESRVVIE